MHGVHVTFALTPIEDLHDGLHPSLWLRPEYLFQFVRCCFASRVDFVARPVRRRHEVKTLFLGPQASLTMRGLLVVAFCLVCVASAARVFPEYTSTVAAPR